MAELIGTATIRVDMNTADAVRNIRRMVNQADGPLRNLQRRIGLVRADLASLRGASISVTVDDGTGPGAARVRAAVRDLQQLGPIRISARIDTDTAGTTAATAALRALRDEAADTTRALRGLAAQALAAAAALRLLGTQARSLRGDMDDLDGVIRRVRDGLNNLGGGFGDAGGAVDKLRSAALLLAPALLPIAAQAIHILPLAANFGAAAVAVGVFGAAIAGQVVAIKDVAEAEKKAADAVKTHGASSAEAAKAQDAYRAALSALPPATRTAAAAFSVLSDQYREWSDSLADNTMPVATKAFAAFGAVFPKLTPLVQGTSQQLNRFVTIAAGGVQSAGFDRFMQSFAEFATGALSKANDALIRFTRTLDTGKISGGVAEFMEYARANGPLVRDVLSNVAQALGNILEGAANVGPGLLVVVNALAGIAAAVPPGVITAMLQLAIALKAVRLAAVAMAASSTGLAAFGAAITAMRVAAAGATGVLPRLAAAIGVMSRATKIALAGTGIGLLVIALTELSQIGRQAPPDVDKLTGSLARLGKSGKVAGEAARAFGSDLGGLNDKVQALTDPGTADKVQQFLVGWTGWDSTPVKEAKENLDSVDKALANLVKDGKADLAAAALKRLTAEYGKGGRDTKEFTSRLDDYKASLEDAKFEQQLAADAMGLFGQQAQATSAKLAEQKQSTDGLRQAIHALNEATLMARGGIRGMEAAIDAAAEAARENGRTLDENTEKGRANNQALDNLASSTMKAAEAARENGASWSTVNGIYDRGRGKLIESAIQMGLTRKEAKALADQILKTPNKTALLKADITDWKTKISAAEKQLKTAKGDKKAKLTADIADWRVKVAQAEQQLVKAKGNKRAKLTADIDVWKAKVAQAEQQLKTAKGDKKAKLTANIDDWQSKIAEALRAINNLPRSRSTKLTAHYVNITENRTIYTGQGGRGPNAATGGLYTGSGFKYRGKGYANGGMVEGPGTGTSDSVFAPWLSKNEFVVNARRTRQHLPLLKAINDGRLDTGTTSNTAGMAGSSAIGRIAQAIVAMMRNTINSAAERARTLAASAVSAISRDIGRGLITGLQTAMPQVAAAAKKATAAATPRTATMQRASSSQTTGFGAATAELQRLVDTGRWTRSGSMLFEDISFQGMSKNFQRHQMKIADGFWAAVNEIKKAVKSGKKVFEDMTFKGMSSNVNRFHDEIAQIWKGNPYGRNFGDWGNFGSYGRYGKYADGGLIQGPGTGTSDRVPVLASDGEYMIRAAAVRRYGVGLFDQLNSMTTRSPRTTGPSSTAPSGDLHLHIHNDGVIGSQLELDNWLAKSMDRLNRTNRLPVARRA